MVDIKEKVEKQRKAGGSPFGDGANSGTNPEQQFQNDFSAANATSDAARVALGALKELTVGIQAENIKGLNKRLDSLNSIEQYVKAEKIGSDEEEIVLSLIKKIRTLILNFISQKKAVMSKAANSISKSSINLGNTLILMSKNDPLMKMAVASGGLLSKKIKEYRKKVSSVNPNQKFLDDMNKAGADIDQATEKSGGPLDLDSLNKTEPKNSKGKGRKKKGGSPDLEPNNQPDQPQQNPELEALQQIQLSVANLDNNVLEIAQDTAELLMLAKLSDARQKNAEMDNLEAQSETGTAGFQQAKGTETKDAEKSKGMFSGFTMSAGGLFKGLGGMATVGIASLVGGLLWAVVDGLTGVFKSNEWGVSKLSGFLGAFFGGAADGKITNVLGNMGKWALIGAGLGSVFPVVGTVIGGLIGAAVGGILGFFGGEKLAKFFENLGSVLKVAFDAVINWGTQLYDWVNTSVSDMWGFLSDAITPAIDMVKEGFNWVADKLSFILDPLKETITQVVDWFSNITKKFWDWLDSITPDWAKDVVGSAKDLGGKAVDAVSSTASSAWDATKGAVSSATNAVSSFFGADSANASMASAPKQQGLTQAPTQSQQTTPTGPTPQISQAPGADTMKQSVLKELGAAGISDPTAQANIMAQIERESRFAPKSENMNYSPERLMQTFPKYFKNIDQAKAVVAQGPEAVANIVYGGRMGNGANEGYKYRGRGLIQLTGKDNYAQYGKMIGVDLLKNPDLANDPEVASKLAVAYFKDKQNKGKNLSDINQVNKSVGFADPSGKEGEARKNLASKFAQQIQAGQYQTMPASNQANKDIVASKSAPPPTQPVIINNNSSNVNNVKGGGGSAPPQPQGSNGTSARRMSYSAAIGK